MKKAEFWNIYPEFLTFWPKKLNQNTEPCFFVFKKESDDTILKNFNKNFLTTWIHSTFLRSLNLDNSL